MTKRGFTLVEISIVLIIIGLIIGGVLVGQDLIRAAGVRAQITQIEKYTTAVNTFRTKYGYFPGDIPNPAASSFGFTARGTHAGEGDGNGIIQGVYTDADGATDPWEETAGETMAFWVDLSSAGLIDGGFTQGTEVPSTSDILPSALGSYFPPARIGQGNYIMVSGSGGQITGSNNTMMNTNMFTIENPGEIWTGSRVSNGSPGLTVAQAYNIDKKIDDGAPQSGRVRAEYMYSANGAAHWAVMGLNTPTMGCPATAPGTSTCYDNNSVGCGITTYSMSINNGTGVNCGLDFRLQE